MTTETIPNELLLPGRVIDEIANDGRRNAAGGIYATSVHEFARAIEAEVWNRRYAAPQAQSERSVVTDARPDEPKAPSAAPQPAPSEPTTQACRECPLQPCDNCPDAAPSEPVALVSDTMRDGFSAALLTVCRTLMDEGEKPSEAWLKWLFKWGKTMDRGAIIESHIDAAVAALSASTAAPQPADAVLRSDAERYRWLRKKVAGKSKRMEGVYVVDYESNSEGTILHNDTLDAFIDRARAAVSGAPPSPDSGHSVAR